jgi:hypothetical protein
MVSVVDTQIDCLSPIQSTWGLDRLIKHANTDIQICSSQMFSELLSFIFTTTDQFHHQIEHLVSESL